MKTIINLFFLLLPVLAMSQTTLDKVSGYTLQYVNGSRVYVEDAALKNHKSRTEAAIELLETKLVEIDKMKIQASVKTLLKTIPFFIDWNIDPTKAAGMFSAIGINSAGFTHRLAWLCQTPST